MDFNRLFELIFWLDLAPTGLHVRTAMLFASFFIIMILLKFVGKLVYMRYKKELLGPEKRMIRMIESFLLTMGFTGIIWTFFAYEGLPVVAARFWVIVWLVSAALWVYVIIYYMLVDMPKELKNLQHKERFEKYLPKKKS